MRENLKSTKSHEHGHHAFALETKKSTINPDEDFYLEKREKEKRLAVKGNIKSNIMSVMRDLNLPKEYKLVCGANLGWGGRRKRRRRGEGRKLVKIN